MEKYITEITIGIYTVIYLIVFLIQKSQIDKLKDTNKSMKDFMDIFKIDEVKKYVELKTERIMMSAENFLKEDGKLEGLAKKSVLDNSDKIIEVYKQQIKDDQMELVAFVADILKQQPIEERNKILEHSLPKTERFFSKILADFDKKKES